MNDLYFKFENGIISISCHSGISNDCKNHIAHIPIKNILLVRETPGMGIIETNGSLAHFDVSLLSGVMKAIRWMEEQHA